MLEALKRIDAIVVQPLPAVENLPTVDTQASCTPATSDMTDESVPAGIDSGASDVESTELHSQLEDELKESILFPVLVQVPYSVPPIAETVEPDVIDVEKTLDQVDSAVASALSVEQSDVYEMMSQYITARLTPHQPEILLLTSSGDGEGKTVTLFSLSKTLADHLHGEVIVVDANFHRPDFTRLWGGTFNYGLDEVLSGSRVWQQVVCKTTADRLSILPNRGLERNTKRHFTAQEWSFLFDQLRKWYQLVLVDGPSLAHAETASIVSGCDGVYLAVRLGYTSPRAVREAVRVVQQAGGQLLGGIVIGGP